MTRELDNNSLRDCVIAMMTRPQGHATSDDELYVTWGLTPFGRSRDSERLDDSNFERIHEDLAEAYPDDTGVLHDGHWGFGWLETVIVRVMQPRPEQPPRMLYGAALDAWLASWEYDEARVRDLKGAALARWLETRVTPVTRRVAEIIAALQEYPAYDSADLSARELEKARDVFADRRRDVLFLWNDDPEDEDYDGPPLPEEPPGSEGPFWETWDAFFDGWQASSGETAPPAQALKDVLKESDGYKDWARKKRQVPGQAEPELFTITRPGEGG